MAVKEWRNFECKGVKLCRNELFNTSWIEQYIGRKPNVIMEFGSYDGGDGVNYKQIFPDASVYSIEACPERFKVISSYIDKFDVKAFNYAMCDYDGEIEFYQMTCPDTLDHPGMYGGSGSINKKTDLYKQSWSHIEELAPIKTPCRRLDTLCKEENIGHIDFLHVDVEGAEHKVVKGFGELRPSMLWLETHLGKEYYGPDAYIKTELNEHLISIGYMQIIDTPNDTLYVLQKDFQKFRFI